MCICIYPNEQVNVTGCQDTALLNIGINLLLYFFICKLYDCLSMVAFSIIAYPGKLFAALPTCTGVAKLSYSALGAKTLPKTVIFFYI